MAVILRDLYQLGREPFRLELIAGEAGLDRVVNWVYVAEDYSTSDFLRGGELIITTGVISGGSSRWLLRFLRHMTAQNTSGLIINEGQYLHREEIGQEVLDFCEKHRFSLLLMPWWVHIYDITRTYYDRIFLDTRRSEELSRAFLTLLEQPEEAERSLAYLERHGFPPQADYVVSVVDTGSGDMERRYALTDSTALREELESIAAEGNAPCHLVIRGSEVLLIEQSSGGAEPEGLLRAVEEKLREPGQPVTLYTGVGGVSAGLQALHLSWEQARAALRIGRSRGQTVCRYEELGVFQLFHAVTDKQVLRDYAQQLLGPVRDYDRRHQRALGETLRLYLFSGGSIQAVAEASFCHRNTINHRLQQLRQLGCRLDDPAACYELMTALRIEEYLRAGENH